MKNQNYMAPSHLYKVFSITDEEPTTDQLNDIWVEQGLTGCEFCSDLIEVYQSNQLNKAFLERTDNLAVGDVLTPNPASNEDALNYLP